MYRFGACLCLLSAPLLAGAAPDPEAFAEEGRALLFADDLAGLVAWATRYDELPPMGRPRCEDLVLTAWEGAVSIADDPTSTLDPEGLFERAARCRRGDWRSRLDRARYRIREGRHVDALRDLREAANNHPGKLGPPYAFYMAKLALLVPAQTAKAQVALHEVLGITKPGDWFHEEARAALGLPPASPRHEHSTWASGLRARVGYADPRRYFDGVSRFERDITLMIPLPPLNRDHDTVVLIHRPRAYQRRFGQDSLAVCKGRTLHVQEQLDLLGNQIWELRALFEACGKD